MIRIRSVALPFFLTCAASGAAWAQVPSSSVSAYGLVDVSAGRFQNAGTPRLNRVEPGSMATSYFGFGGAEEVGGTLKAKFAIESFLRADSGTSGRFTGDPFWARNAYVGLAGEFGATTLGRNTTALFVSTLLFNPLVDSFGFSPSIRQVFTPTTGMPFYGDSRWNNSVSYTSNPISGATYTLQGNLREGAADGVGNNLAGNVIYFRDAWGATLAFQRVKNGLGVAPPAGFTHQDTALAGLSYDFKVAKLFGQYIQVKTEAAAQAKTKIAQIGVSVPLGGGQGLVQYGQAKAAPLNVTNKTVTVGYDYNFSKLTDVYALAMHDRLTGLSNGNSLAAGIRVKF